MPPATPESVGLSCERLLLPLRGRPGFENRHEAGGIVTLVAREGKVVDVYTTGFQDVEPDANTRILPHRVDVQADHERRGDDALRGRQAASTPTRCPSTFRRSGQWRNSRARTTVRRPADQIRDLLSHRSGLSYGFLNGGPVGEAYRKEGVTDGLTTTPMTLAEGIDKLAAQPLMVQPGSAWNYSLSFDVLGRVVEVVSGTPFDVFLRDRIFKPLDMIDTSFVVPESKWPRLATVYSPVPGGGIRPMQDPEAFGNTRMSPAASYKEGKTYFSGGAGLTSTARDYARFANMLVAGGALGSVRLLSPKTVELMASSHTSDIQIPRSSARARPSGSASKSLRTSPRRRRWDRSECMGGMGFTAPSSGSIPRNSSCRS